MSSLDKQIGGNHYSKLRIQPIEYCVANDLGGPELSVIKYVTRFKDKGGLEDLRKAIHVIELMIELHEKYDVSNPWPTPGVYSQEQAAAAKTKPHSQGPSQPQIQTYCYPYCP